MFRDRQIHRDHAFIKFCIFYTIGDCLDDDNVVDLFVKAIRGFPEDQWLNANDEDDRYFVFHAWLAVATETGITKIVKYVLDRQPILYNEVKALARLQYLLCSRRSLTDMDNEAQPDYSNKKGTSRVEWLVQTYCRTGFVPDDYIPLSSRRLLSVEMLFLLASYRDMLTLQLGNDNYEDTFDFIIV